MLGTIPGVKHIELRAHLVLANLTGPDPQGSNGPYNGGPFAPQVKSIRVRVNAFAFEAMLATNELRLHASSHLSDLFLAQVPLQVSDCASTIRAMHVCSWEEQAYA
jgi:hypothetical protein